MVEQMSGTASRHGLSLAVSASCCSTSAASTSCLAAKRHVPAEGREHGPPRRSLEKPLTEAFLKGGDTTAGHRLRHPRGGRSDGETAALAHADKRTTRSHQIHELHPMRFRHGNPHERIGLHRCRNARLITATEAREQGRHPPLSPYASRARDSQRI